MSEFAGAPAAAPTTSEASTESAPTESKTPVWDSLDEGPRTPKPTSDTKAVDPKIKADSKDEDEEEEKKKKASAPKESSEEKKPEQKAEAPKEPEAPKTPERRKLKINGKEVELEQSEIDRRAALFSSAEDKFQEAAQMRKEAQSVVEALRGNTEAVLEALGIDVDAFAEERLSRQVQRSMMSPEQQELEDLRAYRSQQEQTQQQTQQQQQQTEEQQRTEQMVHQYRQQYDQDITRALSQVEVPKTAATVRRVAVLMKNALNHGYDLPVETAASMVQEELRSDVSTMYGGLEGEQLIKQLGPELTRKIRAYDLAQIKARRQGSTNADVAETKIAQQTRVTRSKEPEFLSQDDWKEKMRKKAGF